MAVQIAQASNDERGKLSGGQAGDQTGKEVFITNWYLNGWTVLLRPTSTAVANKIASAAKAGAANNKIGYNQNTRNSLNTQAKKVNYDLSKITVACDCDCSSFATVCAYAAGIDVPYNSYNAPTTSTMRNAFTSTGQFIALTDSKYLTQDAYLKAGDILVKPGYHTIIVVSNGSLSGNETNNSSNTNNLTTIYKVGTVYTTQISNLRVRAAAGTNATIKTKAQLTADGQKNSNAKGQLNAGVKVTCQAVEKIGNDIWIKIPSGWIAAYYQGQHYVR